MCVVDVHPCASLGIASDSQDTQQDLHLARHNASCRKESGGRQAPAPPMSLAPRLRSAVRGTYRFVYARLVGAAASERAGRNRASARAWLQENRSGLFWSDVTRPCRLPCTAAADASHSQTPSRLERRARQMHCGASRSLHVLAFCSETAQRVAGPPCRSTSSLSIDSVPSQKVHRNETRGKP